mmetsp:Transcript_10145/g.14662  ORF Transcript_10145/g.14662 Transcript_10145/m.14662 type:complete len:92 (+) Transcript_10145:551-826(+)
MAYNESKGLPTKVTRQTLTEEDMKVIADEKMSVVQVANQLGKTYHFIHRHRMLGKMTELEKKEFDDMKRHHGRTAHYKMKKIPLAEKKESL